MPVLTDIWFRTNMELESLGQQIGLTDIQADAENYWCWIIGEFNDVLIDITRTHTVPPEQTDTRLFLYPRADDIAGDIADKLVSRLHALHISPVYLGSWVYKRGDEYEKQILQTRTS
ncbi:MAG: hypothetical protein ACXWDN_10295 [Limisphaerales bacterium]